MAQWFALTQQLAIVAKYEIENISIQQGVLPKRHALHTRCSSVHGVFSCVSLDAHWGLAGVEKTMETNFGTLSRYCCCGCGCGGSGCTINNNVRIHVVQKNNMFVFDMHYSFRSFVAGANKKTTTLNATTSSMPVVV